MTNPRISDAEREAEMASLIFGRAARFFTAAADMMSKGAPYRGPEVQRMIASGRMALAELPDRRH